jgi:predicted DsbA family dithiol-disulfide isomerase
VKEFIRLHPYILPMDENTDSLVVYSDYVCPFCYLGRQSLEQYQETHEDEPEIDWHPFDLRSQKRGPDGTIDDSIDDGKNEDYYEQVRENVQRLRQEYDADEMLSLDEVPDVDSLDAQIASLYIKHEHPDRWLAFDEAVFEALWREGRDIGDIDVLSEIAENVGIDGDEIRDAVADDQLRNSLFEKFTEAQRDGVTGVPTFAYDGHAARGAVPPEQLERLIQGA